MDEDPGDDQLVGFLEEAMGNDVDMDEFAEFTQTMNIPDLFELFETPTSTTDVETNIINVEPNVDIKSEPKVEPQTAKPHQEQEQQHTEPVESTQPEPEEKREVKVENPNLTLVDNSRTDNNKENETGKVVDNHSNIAKDTEIPTSSTMIIKTEPGLEVDQTQLPSSSSAARSRHDSLPICFKHTLNDEFVRNRRKFGLGICSVIVFDVLKLGDKILHKNESASASIFPTMKRLVYTRQNIKEMHRLEGSKRTYYRKKLNRILRKEKHNIGVGHKNRHGGDKNKSSQHRHDVSSSHHRLSEQERKRRKLEDAKKKNERPPDKFSAGGTRILPFERRKDHKENKDHNQQIKRPKKEEKEVKVVKEFFKKRPPEKTETLKQKPLPTSFRIPKRADDYPRDRPTTSTPLNSYGGPRDTLRFDRFPRGGGGGGGWRSGGGGGGGGGGGWNFKSGGGLKCDFRRENLLDDSKSEHLSDTNASLEDLPPPPISEVEFGPMVEGVTKLLESNPVAVELPSKDDRSVDLITHKCAWWFKTMDKDPISYNITNPEVEDRICVPTEPNDDEDSFIGNVSNDGEQDNDCQINEVSSSTENLNPALTDEFCGSALINTKGKYRATYDKDHTDGGTYKFIFEVARGCNYEKESFQAKCNICDERIGGKKFLGPHIRSSKHIENLKNLSLKIMSTATKNGVSSHSQPQVKVEQPSSSKQSGTTERVSRRVGEDSKNIKDSNSTTNSKSSDKRRSSRRRSRSPRRRSASRERHAKSSSHRRPSPSYRRRHDSPHLRKKRSTSQDLVDAFLARTKRSRSKSPYGGSHSKKSKSSRHRSRSPKVQNKRKDNEIFREKLTLTAQGKWTPELEAKWKLMEKEEAIISKKYQDYRKQLIEKPEEHPLYAAEWTEFWGKKYNEVQASGKDPDGYDYVPEWKEFWGKKSEFLIDIDHTTEIDALRRKYSMDISSLRKLSTLITLEAQPSDPSLICNAGTSSGLSTKFPVIEEDFTARSMSISDGGGGSDRVEKIAQGPTIPVTVFDVKSTWETLTRQGGGGITENNIKQESSSHSGNDRDFDGFNLIEVLQLVSGLEDQLSFLAPRVKAFIKKGEEMEEIRKGESYLLLENVEFVTLIKQCKDRFNTLLQPNNVVATEKLQDLKLSLCLLALVLATPACKKIADGLHSDTQLKSMLPATDSTSIRNKPQTLTKNNLEASGVNPSKPSTSSRPTQLNSFLQEKKAIADLLTSNLIAMGKQSITDAELELHVFNALKSILKKHLPSSPTLGNNLHQKASSSARAVSPNNRNSYNFKNEPVEVDRVVGTALPPLPSISVRAASPPTTSSTAVIYQPISSSDYKSRPYGNW